MRKKALVVIVGGLAAVGMSLAVAAPANADIVLYQYAGYSGITLSVVGGTNYVGDSFNDKTSSLKINSPSSYAVLWQNKNHTGVSTQRFYIGWNDLAVSGYTTSDGSLMDNRTSSVS